MIEYFKNITKYNITRFCPICERQITYSDYIKTNPDLNNYIIWRDQRIAIPCCECFHLMRLFESKNIGSSVIIEIIERLLSISGFPKIKIKNLKKFGLI